MCNWQDHSGRLSAICGMTLTGILHAYGGARAGIAAHDNLARRSPVSEFRSRTYGLTTTRIWLPV